jgi:hypothetical protein
MGVLVDMQSWTSRTFVSLMLALIRLLPSVLLSSQRIWALYLWLQRLSTLCRYFLAPYAKSADIAKETLIPIAPRNPDGSWQRLMRGIEIWVDASFSTLDPRRGQQQGSWNCKYCQ